MLLFFQKGVFETFSGITGFQNSLRFTNYFLASHPFSFGFLCVHVPKTGFERLPTE